MSALPEQNMLFGLLALQNGLIDQVQLVAAFQAWTRDKTRPLAEYLINRGELDARDQAAIESLVVRNLEKHQGSALESLATLPTSHSTWKNLSQIHFDDTAIDATLVHLGADSTVSDGEGGLEADRSFAVSDSVGASTSDGQRFRILRPHARGGLGTVSVALDTELHREVALKQIIDEYADDPLCRQRFLLEAEVTGGLEHPGIVPVYGLGTHAGGRPYYAMRFVRGDSLKEAIDAFHALPAGSRDLELRKLLRRFLDVCNAIDYAHVRGVLHRDLKPANVILGCHGETLVVDWGLAKATGKSDLSSGGQMPFQSRSSGSSETLPGSALGTPAYMSPEQAEGQLQRLGPQSDVYSLGATLYCLLTGEPPFVGGAFDVVRRVQRGDFRPPRALDPSIDRALEAVRLRAMALRPEERYGSCSALAEDVERWMAGEPVTAWREPFSARARRWGRRNRTAVTAAVAALLAALAGTVAVLAVQTRANVELTGANRALAVANASVQRSNRDLQAANAREKQRFDLALEAIKLFHGDVSEDLLLKQKPFEALRTKLLRGAADFYGKLEGIFQGHTDPASRAALASAYEELGALTSKIGNRALALGLHRKALAVRRTLASLPDAGFEAKLDIARSLLSAGTLERQMGDSAGALASYQEARLLAEELQAARTSDRALSVLADAHRRLGGYYSDTGKPSEALAQHAAALAIQEKLALADTGNSELQAALASSYNALAGVLLVTGRPSEALRSYETARLIRQALVAKNPGSPELLTNLAVSHFNIGLTLASTGKTADALASYEKSRGIWGALVDSNPTVTSFQSDLADAHYAVGHTLVNLGRHSEAVAAMEKARSIWQALVAANPTVTEFRSHEANAVTALGGLKEEMGKLAEARALYDRARSINQALADANPHVTEFQRTLAFDFLHLGIVAARSGQRAAALKYDEKARTILQALADANPSVVGFQAELAITVVSIGRLRQADGRLAEAAEAFRRGASLVEQLAMRSAHDLYNLDCFHSLLSSIAGQPGTGLSTADGQAHADQAVTWLRKAAKAGYGDFARWQADTDLVPLRSRPDVQLLLMDVAMPRDPFARAP